MKNSFLTMNRKIAFGLYLVSFSLVLSGISYANGPSHTGYTTGVLEQPSCAVRDSTNEPLIILDKCSYTGRLDHYTLDLLNVANLTNIVVYKSNDPKAKVYGAASRNGVVLISLKDSVTLIPLPQLLLTRYHIDTTGKKLKICINKELLEDPDHILADKNADLKIEIEKGKNWVYSQEMPVAEQVINIITRDPNKLYIR